MSPAPDRHTLTVLDVPLERDRFLRDLLSELACALEDVIGVEDASGFVSVVGQRIGQRINSDYRAALQVSNLNRRVISQVLVDLKRRLGGDFYIIEETEDAIVLGNRACPLGEHVVGRPSLCMLTSSIFGAVVAENAGYAKVELQQTIAQGHGGCRVVVYLRPTAESEAAEGREYVKG